MSREGDKGTRKKILNQGGDPPNLSREAAIDMSPAFQGWAAGQKAVHHTAFLKPTGVAYLAQNQFSETGIGRS